MGDDARYADLAARLLRERPPAPPSHTSRDEGVSAVAQALAQRKRRRATRTALGAGAFAVAASAALVLFWPASGERREATRACSGGPCPSAARLDFARVEAPATVLSVGESLVAPLGAPASVVLATGTRITLDERSTLERREDTSTQRFAVLHGRARLQVAKLHAGERFLVETPSAEIEVRGTVFSVRVEEPVPGCPSRTAVEVEEGIVAVRSGGGELLVRAGEHWASECPEARPPAMLEPVHAAAAAPQPKSAAGPGHVAASTAVQAAPAAVVSAAPSSPALPVSMLTEQNDLYARAQVAQREGRRAEALAAYARLLELFPHGPLAETALVHRVRLLETSDAARARLEAKMYVERFADGIAAEEMQRLLRAP